MKKKIIIASMILTIIAVVVLVSLYISERKFRDWIDVHLLGKDIIEEELPIINLNTDKLNQVHVYSKYIAVLSDKKIKLYNSYGEENESIDVDINSGIFDSNGKYLAVAEDHGNNLYLILDKTYLWSKTIEGEILQIHVNANGYVVVITKDSTNKSILTMFNSLGTKLFKSYFASTRIVDVSISEDNKYIAIGEMDSSGSIIQSNVKIISVENAQNNAENAIVYTYNADGGDLIIKIKYQDKNHILCMYDKKICIISDKNNDEIIKAEDDSIAFMTVNFSNHIAYVKEELTSIFNSKSNIEIINTNNNESNSITIEDTAKEIYAKDNVIGINLGTEMYFYDTNLWLVKKYTAKQEITNVDFSSSLAAVIYKDKIVVIGF